MKSIFWKSNKSATRLLSVLTKYAQLLFYVYSIKVDVPWNTGWYTLDLVSQRKTVFRNTFCVISFSNILAFLINVNNGIHVKHVDI